MLTETVIRFICILLAVVAAFIVGRYGLQYAIIRWIYPMRIRYHAKRARYLADNYRDVQYRLIQQGRAAEAREAKELLEGFANDLEQQVRIQEASEYFHRQVRRSSKK